MQETGLLRNNKQFTLIIKKKNISFEKKEKKNKPRLEAKALCTSLAHTHFKLFLKYVPLTINCILL